LNKTLNHKKTKKKTNINQNNKGQIWYKNQWKKRMRDLIIKKKRIKKAIKRMMTKIG
jgi:hypothetical protein